MRKLAVLFLLLSLTVAFADPDRFTDPGVYSVNPTAQAGSGSQ